MYEESLTSNELNIIKTCGFSKRCGFGNKCALLVIDVQNKFPGEPIDIIDSIKTNPLSLGLAAYKCKEKIETLINLFRSKDLPILFSKDEMQSDGINPYKMKCSIKPQNMNKNANDLAIKCNKNDLIIKKSFPSAFFKTDLNEILVSKNIDTLVVTGFVTSGCVRATVVDAFSNNYKVIIPEECVMDRFPTIHKYTLLDLDIKYADVVTAESVVKHINQT